MKPTTGVHEIARLQLTEVKHFPAKAGADHREFWTRTIIFTGHDGDTYQLPLYSNAAEGLLTDDERKLEAEREGMYQQHRRERFKELMAIEADRNLTDAEHAEMAELTF